MPKRLLLVVFFACSCRVARAQSEWQAIGSVTAVKALPNGVELVAGKAGLQVLAVTPSVIRLLYTPDGTFAADHSFAVLPHAFPQPPKTTLEQEQESVSLKTEALQIKIDRSSMSVTFGDSAGKFIARDSSGAPVWFNGNAFRVWKFMPEDEHYFALGDKAGPLDHRNLAFTMWNTDAYGWEESTDPLYKDIPFLLALRQGAAYGLFLDNTYRSSFDLGKSARHFYSFSAEGGPLDYYFIYGPDPKKVVQDFTTLVGRTALPPLFALGFQQSRYSYYPESQVREIASEFRRRKIPADVLYLDIDYQQDNRPFTINRERFPNFEGMVKDLKSAGFKLVLITDLHIAKSPGYKPYDEGIAHDYFVKNPDGSVYVGKVWPGDSVFPDFTRAEVRQWWGSLYADFVKMGVRGFWNDMNEPSVFKREDKTMPLDVVHRVDGRKTDHREIHNVYGMENVQGTYQGILRLQPEVRPFVLTRAAYAGAQRYAATWTGDNSSMWNHMRISIPQILNLGLSGFAFAGADVGGFRGSPPADLLTRWMEVGAFSPFYRNHGEKNSRFREPWVDGPEHEAIRKKYIETRYRLLPYIYTKMEETSRTGIPLIRPMFLEFPADSSLATNDEEFMFGDSFLVAPKVREFAAPYQITLPQGDWYDYWTGAKLGGSQKIEVDPPLDTLPVYTRAGAIIPQQPVVQYVGESWEGPLELRVYAGPDCRGDLYMDDGNTVEYQHGAFSRIHFTCQAAWDHFEINMSPPQGAYKPWFKDVQVVIYGAGRNVKQVSMDGRPISKWKLERGAMILPPFPESGQEHRISVVYATK